MSVSQRDLVVRIFQHLKDLDALRTQAPSAIQGHPGYFWWDSVPQHPAFEKATSGEAGDTLLRVRPPATPCPAPSGGLEEWLKSGWEDPQQAAEWHDELERILPSGTVHRVFFHDEPERLSFREDWEKTRETWASAELAAKTFHEDITRWLSEMEREGERLEIHLGTGLLHLPARQIEHPLLLQPLALQFDTTDGACVFRLTNDAPELYTALLRALPGVSSNKVQAIAEELQQTSPDLTQEEQVKDTLEKLSQAIGAPLQHAPVLLLRRRSQGCQQAIEAVLQELATDAPLPEGLLRLVGLAEEDFGNPSSPAPPINRSALYLSKPANDEQLRIAQRIQRQEAILVQGPPGTGKTHTIANLIGHLLAEGKSILVTSHTTKALRVLRDKVATPLRSLCLSVLDNDAENRLQLNQAVQEITRRLTATDAEAVLQESVVLDERRQQLVTRLESLRRELFDARWWECQPCDSAGRPLSSIEAAQALRQAQETHDWLPGPLHGFEPPLNAAELAFLYQTNVALTPQDELELSSPLPDPRRLASATEYAMVLSEEARLTTTCAEDRPELWYPVEPPATKERIDHLLPHLTAALNTVARAHGWLLEIIDAGRKGGAARQTWEELGQLAEALAAEADAARPALLTFGPQIRWSSPEEIRGDEAKTLQEIAAHLKAGGTLGLWVRTTRREWRQLLERCTVAGIQPSRPEHFQALAQWARLHAAREAFRARWQRQVGAVCGPDASTLGPEPEKTALPIATDLRALLDWYGTQWEPVQHELQALGFHWEAFVSGLSQQRQSDYGELARIRAAATRGLEKVVTNHGDAIRLAELQHSMTEFTNYVQGFSSNPVGRKFLEAVEQRDPVLYSEAGRRLGQLWPLEEFYAQRVTLLRRLERHAPAWAQAIRHRLPKNDQALPLGDPATAWRYRLLVEEVEGRTRTSLNDLQRKIEAHERELLDLTAQLVERKAWASRKRGVTMAQQAAMEGYTQCITRLSQTGRGRRDGALLAAARQHLVTARTAVPVWIMPLARVYESFFAKGQTTRFDVVIIDEASQSDVTALAALYLGAKVIVVGDEEQVTPTPFADGDAMERLIELHLQGVPNHALYDLETSVYHLARTFFRERIFLREHFRCVPSIIKFSNDLSYDGYILPLREASSSPLHPPLLSHRVKDGSVAGKVNANEAEELVALLMACLEQPEYQLNEAGEPLTFGVISMVGDAQTAHIETLLRARLSPVEWERRRMLCGNAAQFQGDERDVIFLSLVDASHGQATLPLRGFGPKDIFRKRFNVAASRARQQLWVIHSLDHLQQLNPGDLRRRLIQHALSTPTPTPSEAPDESISPFEQEVQQYLRDRSYEVIAGWRVGVARVGLYVTGLGCPIAVECDGERTVGREELEHDMARQSSLERLGWRFLRVRASAFYQNADQAMEEILTSLAAISQQRNATALASATDGPKSPVLDRILRRAPELRWAWSERQKSATTDRARPHYEGPNSAAIKRAGAMPAPEASIVETGDWVEFQVIDAASDPQLVNIVSSATDLDKSAINLDEPLARALLGRTANEIGAFEFNHVKHQLRILQIHKPRRGK